MNDNQLTLGIITAGAFSMYDASVCAGISDVAEELGIGIIYLPIVLHPSYLVTSHENVIIDHTFIEAVLALNHIDCIVSFAGELDGFFPKGLLETLYEQLHPLPIINLGYGRDGKSTIGNVETTIDIDNYSGAAAVMRHVIEDCGYQKIALVQASYGSYFALARYNACCDVMREHGYELDDRWVADATYRTQSGIDAVETIIDERKLNPDVFVCGNDDMALGVTQALKYRGIRVPEDIAVTGFDNSTGAMLSDPPLTTVRQPLYHIGRQAAKLAVSVCRGEKLEPVIIVDTRLVVRTSTQLLHPEKNQPDSNLLFEAVNMFAYPLSLTDSLRDEMVGLFMTDCVTPDSNQFQQWFVKLLDEKTAVSMDYWLEWQLTLNNWRTLTKTHIHDAGQKLKAYQVIAAAQSVLTEQIARKGLYAERSAHSLAIAERELFANMSYTNLLKLFEESLHEYAVQGCYLAIYNTQPYPSNTVRLLYTFDINDPKGVRHDQSMPFEQFYQQALETRPTAQWMAINLTFQQEYFGVMLVSTTSYQPKVYETLRAQILTAFKLIYSRNQLQRHADTLQAEVENRTLDLQFSLTEKDELLSIVAHDLRNPLTAININLQLLHRARKTNSFAQVDKYIGRIEYSTDSMLTLITQLLDNKSEAAAQFNVDLQPVTIAETMTEAIERASSQANAKSIQINVSPISVDLIAEADPFLLAQALENILSNAIKFSPPRRSIYINSHYLDKQRIQISIRDEGQGLSHEDMADLFGKYKRLSARPTAGESSTGLGLYIVRKMVQAMDGDITAVSPGKNQGTTFIFTLNTFIT